MINIANKKFNSLEAEEEKLEDIFLKTRYDEPNIINEQESTKGSNIGTEKDWILIDLSKKVRNEPESDNGTMNIKSINLV